VKWVAYLMPIVLIILAVACTTLPVAPTQTPFPTREHPSFGTYVATTYATRVVQTATPTQTPFPTREHPSFGTYVATTYATRVVQTATPVSLFVATPQLMGITQPPQGKYLFVEFRKVVGGKGNLPPMRMDFPTYQFNRGTGELDTGGMPAPATNYWGLVGTSTQLRYPGASGERSLTYLVKDLPYSNGSPFTVTLIGIDTEGRAEFIINTQHIILKSGEQYNWELVVAHKDSDLGNLGNQQYDGQFIFDNTIINHGWQDRSRIQFK
jgi:hypothetical protein